MIYGIFGNDDEKKKSFLEGHRATHHKDISFVVRDEHDFSLEELQQEVLGGSLFGDKIGFVLKNILTIKENIIVLFDLFSNNEINTPIYFYDSEAGGLEGIFKSENYFLFKKEAELPDFSLYNALYNGTKKDVWLAYIQKIKNEPFELVHAGILSQVKNMYLTKIYSGTAKDLGFNTEKTFLNAKRAAEKYSIEEIKELYSSLVLLPTKSRFIGIPPVHKLEEILLKYIK